jgi:RNA polymerase sigma-70 factor (ECF subfamily)
LSIEVKQAFVTAIERTHGQRLRRFLAFRIRNAADLPDLVQEVYLRLLRIDHHETIRNPQAYLYTVASHVLHQHAMRQAVSPAVMDSSDFGAELEGTADADPATQVDLEQRFEKLACALQQFSARGYATLVMHRCDGLSLKEIALRLGVSHTMTKRYLAKALAYCQQRLEDMER